ncbi:MAG TPA: radical SAM family heme chaperone HemW [Puia sp.]|jgi:oxygen-independent coproporphyrinogen-3 oxidase|nr:radical SAM family heme chaperone HemW [Puia sp.]
MAGIYLHIPFCRQACHYCNFHFSTSLQGKNDFIPALLKEMEGRKDYIGLSTVGTVYLGGGTPSLLDPVQLRTILDRLREVFVPEPTAEITMEANPDDMTDSRTVQAWRDAGVNRLSIGIQSFFGEDLQWMNRAHNDVQAMECIRMAQGEGFENISIDLIYGGPTLPDDHWKKNVDQAIALRVPHLSCYALTVEPRTALDKLIRSHKRQDVSPDDQARQFILLMDWMEQAGYEHYEISNFALPGHRSRHNSSYWRGETYLGLGPSAHSYDGVSREWNVANNALYIKSLEATGSETATIIEKEILTSIQQLNEYIMISLRTMEGSDLRFVAEKFGSEIALELEKRAQRYVQEGKMTNQGTISLTRSGKLLADRITADLFFE